MVADHMNPGLFIELCNPAWGRVYNELSFNRVSHNERLAWTGEIVRKAFVMLAGFDPGKIQYADHEAQHAALDAARELETALFEADEIEQLDGKPALEFAQGWITARDWIAGADSSALPDEDFVRNMANRFATSMGSPYKQEFQRGFVRRINLGHHFVA